MEIRGAVDSLLDYTACTRNPGVQELCERLDELASSSRSLTQSTIWVTSLGLRFFVSSSRPC